jgi:hypothetical protein
MAERIINYFIGKYVKIRYKIWMLRKEANESNLDLQDLRRMCLEHILPVTYPLAVVAQIEGSGGSFLSQLFDGHPELHAHPHELMIGYPEEHLWPEIDLDDSPERWFGILFEDIVSEYNREGYKRGIEVNKTFPFVFLASLQKEIFLNYLDSIQLITLRDVFDAYMTSYFGAWLSNQNYYNPKKFVTAYTRKLVLTEENMGSFFEVYPDGRVISLVRDPKSWLPSARKRWPESYADIGQALSAWNDSAQEMSLNRERYGDRVCMITFEDLVSKTRAVMLYLAEFLGIEFDDIFLVPTFNTLPLEVNTSFQGEDHGMRNSHLSRKEAVTAEELNTIERMTSETHPLVLKEVVRFD